MRGVLPVAVPHPEVVRPSSTLTVEKEVGGKEADPTTEEAPGDAAPADEVSDKKDTPALAFFPSWDEMVEMLKRVPCITNSESPFTKMSDFFSFTKRISVNLGGDLPSFVSARLPFGTPESAMLRIQQLQDWTVPETVEVVISSILPSFQVMHTPLLGTNLAFVILFSW